ncbi:MAG: helix-hairpin-helix domain-containing protein [Candidatus Omnitrophica bacterium]|nr:helix-hairpin-helix domain-containing protein [Candidatus Omnitrophota bacterium]
MTLWLAGIFTRQERLALAFLMGVSVGGLLLIGWGRRPPFPAPERAELAVDVNRASATELAALPGIGPKLAARIAEDRKRRGRFLTLNDLKRVKGVTPKIIQRIKGMVCFN